MLSQCTLLLFSHPVVSDSLWSHGLQHSRSPYPSSSPRICPNPCPLYWGCCPAISSSDTLFFFCPQSFPESGTFPVSHLFAPDKGNTGASASASIFPVNIQGWFLLRLTGLISLQSKGLSRVCSSTTAQKHQFFSTELSLFSNSHIHTWILEQTIAFWLYRPLLAK